VWDLGQATVRDVKDALSRGKKKPAYSTVLTMMRKLEGKGYLAHEPQGRTYVYAPTLSRQAARRSVLGDLLDRLFDGSPELMVSSLVEQNRVSKKEVEAIRKLLGKKGK
jgi:predicted transcriptional regulator